MRILHVIHSVNPRGGGPIEGIRQLIPALAALGIETEVLSLDAPDAPWTTEFPAHLHVVGPCFTGYGYTPRALPWLRENHANYDAVIVHGLWQYSGFAVWRALRGTTTPYHVFPHGMLDPWFKHRYPLKHLKKLLYWNWIEYRVLRDATGVLFTSEQERVESSQSFGRYDCVEELMGYGIAPPPGDAARQRALFLEKYPALREKRLVLFLGRIHEKKGCDLLLRAWQEISSAAGSHFNYHLIMAGPCDHPYGKAMQALAAQLGLEASVTWTDMITGDLKWGCLRAADVFILPSHQENFGIAVAEALACGVPVLISDKVNIWREIAEDNAGLVESDDQAGTTRLLTNWLGLEPAAKQTMRTNTLHCFATRFTVAQTAQTLSRLLRR